MASYTAPQITELGSLSEVTLNVYKSAGAGDTVYVSGEAAIVTGPIVSTS